MTELPQRPKARADVVFRQLDDEWVLYDPISNRMHVLNLTASLVWVYCTGSMTLEEIGSEIRGAYGDSKPADLVTGDVADAVSLFEQEGLLE